MSEFYHMICTECGHERQNHEIEPPYLCCYYEDSYCPCEGFTVLPMDRKETDG